MAGQRFLAGGGSSRRGPGGNWGQRPDLFGSMNPRQRGEVLLSALAYEDWDTALAITKMPLDHTMRDTDGNTPLLLAAQKYVSISNQTIFNEDGWRRRDHALSSLETIAESLLAGGADPNVTNNFGETLARYGLLGPECLRRAADQLRERAAIRELVPHVPLTDAVRTGDASEVFAALVAGEDSNREDVRNAFQALPEGGLKDKVGAILKGYGATYVD